MRRHPILALPVGAHLLLVGLWPAAAAPVELAAQGALTVLAQPAVLPAVFLGAVAMVTLRRPAPARRRHTNH